MDLNDFLNFNKFDRSNMYQEIQNLPGQLLDAWNLGLKQPMGEIPSIKNIIIAGMGGSAIGADLLASYAAHLCPVPIFVQREYWLPTWANNQTTLVIASSHSGNTEETLSIFEQAKLRNTSRWVISTGGALAQTAAVDKVPVWQFEHIGQPRAAVGHSFGLLLALFYRLGLIPDQQERIEACVRLMKKQQEGYAAAIPVKENKAKILALSMVQKWVYILASDSLAPIARRWKGQVNELAKAWAQFEFLPEADHNTLAGTTFPEVIKNNMKTIILRSPMDHPRNQLRAQLTSQSMKNEGLDVEIVDIESENALSAIWSALLLGDYAAYYLALLYEVDPTPITIMQTLKSAMKNA